MRVSAITMLIWCALAATAAAQGASSGKSASPGASKGQFSEVRAVVRELEARTEKLRELMTIYRSLVEERPRSEGGGPEAKKAHEEQLAKWNSAIERQLRRIDDAREDVAQTTKRLDQLNDGQLPTGLAKDAANAHNEAEAQRAAAEQALKTKRPAARTSKQAKQAPEKPVPPLPADLDL